MTNQSKTIAIITLISIFLPLISGCNQHGEAWEQMDRAERLMNSKPDSALSVLNAVSPRSLGGKEERARYALLKSMALDKNLIDTTDFKVLQPAIDYYLKNGSPDERLRTYYYQGRIYQNCGDNDSAMQSFMRGREYQEKASDTLSVANLLVAQATILYKTYKFKGYIQNNLDAAQLYRIVGRSDYELSCLMNVLDGAIITENKQLADSVLSVAEDRVGEREEYSSILSPYIMSYAMYFGDKDDIVDVLRQYESVGNLDDVTKMDMAEAYCKIGDAENSLRIINSIPFSSEYKSSLKYLAIIPGILELNNEPVEALKAYREFYTTLDSIHESIFSNDLLFAKERHEMEKSNMLKVQKRNKIIAISVCIILVLLIVAVYIYYRYRLSKAKILLEEEQRKRLELEQENLKKRNDDLEHEKHDAIRDKQSAELECERQSTLAKELSLKNRQLEEERDSLNEVLTKQKNLTRPVEDAIRIRVEMLNGLLATQITENESYSRPYMDWKDQLVKDKDEFMNTTRLAFKASHPKFIEYLENHGLDDSEINYVCLYAIGLRGKEVGEYMKMRRHYHISSDIRKKLGIDEHKTNIGIYVRKLMKRM